MRGATGLGTLVVALVLALLANLIIFAALYGGAPIAYAFYAAWQGMCGGPDYYCLVNVAILLGLMLFASFIAAAATFGL